MRTVLQEMGFTLAYTLLVEAPLGNVLWVHFIEMRLAQLMYSSVGLDTVLIITKTQYCLKKSNHGHIG